MFNPSPLSFSPKAMIEWRGGNKPLRDVKHQNDSPINQIPPSNLISLNTCGRKLEYSNPSVLNMGFCQKLLPLKAVMVYMAQSVSTPSAGLETKPRYNVPV